MKFKVTSMFYLRRSRPELDITALAMGCMMSSVMSTTTQSHDQCVCVCVCVWWKMWYVRWDDILNLWPSSSQASTHLYGYCAITTAHSVAVGTSSYLWDEPSLLYPVDILLPVKTLINSCDCPEAQRAQVQMTFCFRHWIFYQRWKQKLYLVARDVIRWRCSSSCHLS